MGLGKPIVSKVPSYDVNRGQQKIKLRHRFKNNLLFVLIRSKPTTLNPKFFLMRRFFHDGIPKVQNTSKTYNPKP
jgi:hypothetical protein